MAIAKGRSQEMIRDKKEEKFLAGLADRTHLEMARLNVNSTVEIIRIISTVEENILEQMEKQEGSFDNTSARGNKKNFSTNSSNRNGQRQHYDKSRI